MSEGDNGSLSRRHVVSAAGAGLAELPLRQDPRSRRRTSRPQRRWKIQ